MDKEQTMTVTAMQLANLTTGRLITEIGDVYTLLEVLVDAPLMRHMLPMANRHSRPYLQKKFPELCVPELIERIYFAGEMCQIGGLSQQWLQNEFRQIFKHFHGPYVIERGGARFTDKDAAEAFVKPLEQIGANR